MRQKGLTIIQLMVILLVAGLVGSVVVDIIIDKRCESAPKKPLCEERMQNDHKPRSRLAEPRLLLA